MNIKRFSFIFLILIITDNPAKASSIQSNTSSLDGQEQPSLFCLEGTITSPEGKPLEGATVCVPELNKICVADSTGHYRLKNLPTHILDVRFSYLGYTHLLKRVTMIRSGVILDVKLESSPIEAEEIVVTGLQQSTQHDNAVKIDVLTMNGHNLQASPNFSEKLTKAPGVDMISKGSGVSKPVIRGLSMNDILILNNGVRVENYQYSSHHPLGIDEFGIDRIEIIKGPASLLYGSDAIGGVLNFIKEQPNPKTGVHGDYQAQLFSNSLGESSSLGLNKSGEHLSGGIRFSEKSHSDYLQGGGCFLPNSRFNEASVKANLNYTQNRGIFHLYYDYIQQNLGLVEEEALDLINCRGRKTDVFYQHLNTHMLSSQNKIYLGETKLELNIGFQSSELIHFGEKDEYELQMLLNTLTYEAKVQLPSDNQSAYILGFQGIHQGNGNLNNRETILLPNAMINNYSAFGFLQQTFGRIKFQTGLRYDDKMLHTRAVGTNPDAGSYRTSLNKNYGSFSGSMGFTYPPTKDLFLRCNLATAYRTPNLAELTSNGFHEAIYEIGDEKLTPEKSLEIDGSVHWHKKYLAIDLAGFYNRIYDYIFQSPTGEKTTNETSIYRYMQGNSQLYGGEGGLHLHPSCIQWLHLESTFSWVIGKLDSGARLPFIPAKKLNLEARGEKKKLAFLQEAFAEIHAHYAFCQDKPAPEETPTSGYSLFDLCLGGVLQMGSAPLHLNFSINNLQDKKYVDHLSTLKEVGGLNPGRNIILSTLISF